MAAAQPNMPAAAVQQRIDVYYRERSDGTWAYRADVVGVRGGRREQHPDTLWADVRAVQCPTLVIRAGGEPPLVSEETAARLSRENPRIEVVTVPGANHNIHFAHFDAFMPLLRQFLAQPSGSPQPDSQSAFGEGLVESLVDREGATCGHREGKRLVFEPSPHRQQVRAEVEAVQRPVALGMNLLHRPI